MTRTGFELFCFAAIVLGATVVGCERRDERRATRTDPLTTPMPSAREGTVEEIEQRPAKYVGRHVTVTGVVDGVFADTAFELEGDGLFWEGKLLVVTRSPIRFGAAMIRSSNDVVVRGTVQRLVATDVERDLGWALSPDVEQRHRGQLILLADSVRLIDPGFRWSEDVREGVIMSMARIFGDVAPGALAGTRVDLDGVPVASRIGNGVWLGYGPRTQLFASPLDGTAHAGIQAGTRVHVRGALRVMPSAQQAAKRFGLDARESKRAAEEALFLELSEIQSAGQ